MFRWSDFSPFISECVWLMGNSCNLEQSYFGPTVGQGPAAWTFSAWAWDHNPGQMHWRLGRWGCMWFCIEGQLRRNCPGNTVENLETVLRPRANIGRTCLFTRSLSNLCWVPLPLLLHGVAQCLHTQTGPGPWAPHWLTPPPPHPGVWQGCCVPCWCASQIHPLNHWLPSSPHVFSTALIHRLKQALFPIKFTGKQILLCIICQQISKESNWFQLKKGFKEICSTHYFMLKLFSQDCFFPLKYMYVCIHLCVYFIKYKNNLKGSGF